MSPSPRALRFRFFTAMSLVGLGIVSGANACGSNVIDQDDDGSVTGSGGSSVGGDGAGGAAIGGNGAGGVAMGGSGAVGEGRQADVMCVPQVPGEDCVPSGWAQGLLSLSACDQITHGPFVLSGECCYRISRDTGCGHHGRPYRDSTGFRVAPVERRVDWMARLGGIDTANIDEPVRKTLAKQWLNDALMEHASIASFGHFALQLMAAGAPPKLVEMAHMAALDEAKHARMTFAVAAIFGGEEVGPGKFDFGSQLSVTDDLVQLAVATFVDGCVNETIAAMLASEQAERTTEPILRQVLTEIAEDETRHAELAWRTISWAIRVGGAEVVEAIRAELKNLPLLMPARAADAHLAEELGHYGRLDSEGVRDVTRRALFEVVMPCAEALLDAASTLSLGASAFA